MTSATVNRFGEAFDDAGQFGAEQERASDGHMVMFAPGGGTVAIENASDSDEILDVLLIAGVPLNESIARYGPVIMNTQEEIYQTFEDYRTARMGAIG